MLFPSTIFFLPCYKINSKTDYQNSIFLSDPVSEHSSLDDHYHGYLFFVVHSLPRFDQRIGKVAAANFDHNYWHHYLLLLIKCQCFVAWRQQIFVIEATLADQNKFCVCLCHILLQCPGSTSVQVISAPGRVTRGARHRWRGPVRRDTYRSSVSAQLSPVILDTRFTRVSYFSDWNRYVI